MNRPAKVILPFFLAAASSLAMAEDGVELTMQRLGSASVTNPTAVAGAECNTVIELKPEHHAASPWHFA